jgi:hypothetical protein
LGWADAHQLTKSVERNGVLELNRLGDGKHLGSDGAG